MITKQISVFIENRCGRAAQVLSSIAGAGIDIHALCIADTSEFGILRMITDDADSAVKTLQSMNLAAKVTDVIAVNIENRPGAAAQVLSLLSDAGVSVEYIYSSPAKSAMTGDLIICVDDTDAAERALTQKE